MKRVLPAVLSSYLLVAPFAYAVDDTDPVREVVEATARNWDEGGEYEEVFSKDRLDRVFSKSFAEAFYKASKNPPYDIADGETTGFPFSYDPIAQGQDGCPFEDIRIENDGDGQVTALFKNRGCFGKEAEYQQDTVLIFHVETEDGRPVIDDIYPVVDHVSGTSIKEELLAVGGQ
ncbi:hypothetical protein ACSV9I_02080 [Rhizobium sp. G187]|uniref:hypothetical protein n=1 Tax=unclassified Rhizobium TaxID=2613769 RepID=UPI0006B919CF|nr:hypothetical protein [Rhizobium sp. AAP43]KPF43824.1 hypothetical protein IP76_13115 [Rhizobium sp. AAP43]